MKTISTATVLGTALVLPTMASAALFDFQQWTELHGEQGFDNTAPFMMTVDNMALTATAYENDLNTHSHVYMDKRYHGIIGGMGVCSKLRTNAHCGPNTDDNISIDAGNVEILSLNFSQNISGMTLEMGDHNHYDFGNADFLYRHDSLNWTQASTDADGFVDLLLGGVSSKIEFRAVAEGFDNTFYIRNAEVSTGIFTSATVVPMPAAVWLFGSGLLALAGMARRRID